MSRCVLILLAFVLAERAASMPLPDGLAPGGTAHVEAALDAMTLRLADGRIVRLAGIETPRLELPRPGADGQSPPVRRPAAATTADRAAADFAAGRDVELYYDERRNDRYGRVVAHVVVRPDLWLQEELVKRGSARVQTTADTATAARALLSVEAEARRARRGLWSQAAYQIRRPDDLRRRLDSFQLVEGRIAEVRRSSNDLWLQFAGQRELAARIAIVAAARRRFRAIGTDPADLAGKAVRVRGWVRWQSGPVIDVDHPAQIELIDQ